MSGNMLNGRIRYQCIHK